MNFSIPCLFQFLFETYVNNFHSLQRPSSLIFLQLTSNHTTCNHINLIRRIVTNILCRRNIDQFVTISTLGNTVRNLFAGPIDGKWGRWSNWSECSAKFAWGIQSRYRICDSPTPKYNGKYCEVSDASKIEFLTPSEHNFYL